MTKYFTNNLSVINLYKKPSKKTEVVTQMIFGESFTILKKTKNWLRVKIKEDGYEGFIQNKKFSNFLKPTHKINILKAKIYKFPNKKKEIYKLSFGSKIRVTDTKGKFVKFLKGWIEKKNLNILSFKNKNPFKKINIFNNVKYKWGGKSFNGIDCSGLVQLCLQYNNKFCPRDAKDQIKFFKNNIKLKNIKKNDIIFWKGHVAVALNNKQLIHAYGPKKKTIIMGINHTVKKIEKTANLKVKKIRRL